MSKATERQVWRTILSVAVTVALANEVVAAVVRARLPLERSLWLVPRLVLVTHHEHVLSLDVGTGVKLLFLLVALPLLTLVLLRIRVDWWRRRSASGGLLRVGLGLMLGAGVAMGAEMVARQMMVTDFFAFGPFPANWTSLHAETYNLADLASYVGEASFLVGLLLTGWAARRRVGRPPVTGEAAHDRGEGHGLPDKL